MVFVAPANADAGKRLAQRQIVCASRGGNAKATALLHASSSSHTWISLLDSLEARDLVRGKVQARAYSTNWVDGKFNYTFVPGDNGEQLIFANHFLSYICT